jgi:uncharacterized phage-associated protein
MTYTPQHVANYFLDRAEIEGAPLTQLKLLKLIYIGYGWNSALTDKKLFSETIEAWKHGPVVPSIYHEFKDFGANPIDKRSHDFDLDSFEFFAPQIPEKDAETRLILDRVWSVYKNFTGWDLRQKTHEVDSPWKRVYNPNVRAIPLKDSDIKEHYSAKIRGYLEAAKAVNVTSTT